ncbi:hypothetical protein LTSEHVI_0790 [Salmonella enterica subsp. enterica serovar Hvittingfoss str. A4-620]|nr:hypothetical protein LTSEHVI_0790 [Salmonella enterica subsp. enterica serovar Hvittingfoss str. A4-620]
MKVIVLRLFLTFSYAYFAEIANSLEDAFFVLPLFLYFYNGQVDIASYFYNGQVDIAK